MKCDVITSIDAYVIYNLTSVKNLLHALQVVVADHEILW